MPSLRQIFLDHIAQTSDAPMMLQAERAEGIYIYDTSGKTYIDLISGIGVSSLGHCHPEVVRAVQEQASKYMHLMVYGEFIEEPQVALAELLSEQLPEKLNSVYLTNSGAESTEGALKLAKKYTGRSKIIAFHHAYHGSTHGALSVMGDDYFKQGYGPLLPDIQFVRHNSQEAIDAINDQCAAVILETIQGEAGIRVPDESWIKAIRNKCDETGTLLILDEIQCGMGRTGTMFAFEQFGIQPDILLLAKAFGGGMPLGAFVADKNIMNCITHDPVLGHITTFGGHPVSCAAALASLKVLTSSDLIEQVSFKAKLFRDLLNSHPGVKEIRSAGLMMCLQLKDPEEVSRVVNNCLELGLITDWFLFAPDCLRIAPPLIIRENEIRKACEIILKAMDAN